MPKNWVNKWMVTINHCLLDIIVTYRSARKIVYDYDFHMFYIIKQMVEQVERIFDTQLPILSST